METYNHYPVLLREVLSYLNPAPGKNMIDATLGGAGYSKALLERITPGGKLLSIDLDTDAISHARTVLAEYGDSVVLAHGNFSRIDRLVKNHEFPPPDGIVADLGLSSYELDQGGRGMSFKKKEPLDMRFDQSQEAEDAKFWLAEKSRSDLERIFREYGEEKFSGRIAVAIDRRRNEVPIKYTTDLYEIIRNALPKPVQHRADDSARRIFQALRIAVNHELQNLEEFLPTAFDLLSPGGRLVVVSFHSLEDRMVKRFFLQKAKGCTCPLNFPQCTCGKQAEGQILTKKVVTAGEAELSENSRSRPAKLRALHKLSF